jgi:hypothetical protein
MMKNIMAWDMIVLPFMMPKEQQEKSQTCSRQ